MKKILAFVVLTLFLVPATFAMSFGKVWIGSVLPFEGIGEQGRIFGTVVEYAKVTGNSWNFNKYGQLMKPYTLGVPSYYGYFWYPQAGYNAGTIKNCSVFNQTAFSCTGTLKQGTKTFSLSVANGFGTLNVSADGFAETNISVTLKQISKFQS